MGTTLELNLVTIGILRILMENNKMRHTLEAISHTVIVSIYFVHVEYGACCIRVVNSWKCLKVKSYCLHDKDEFRLL